MSKLIQLRQRSKAIDTIKKITHAMRLVSMSTHSHLQRLQESFNTYSNKLEQLFTQLMSYAPAWRNPIIHPSHEESHKTLIILIGSQKGLCGSFNTQLFKLLHHEISTRGTTPFDLIAVGQKAVDFAKTIETGTLIQTYSKFTIVRLISIARELALNIIEAKHPYHSVLIAANYSKSFFVQKPEIIPLIPIIVPETIQVPDTQDFDWQEKPAKLLDTVLPQYLESKMQQHLFQSLISEHAARFISMDSATRNAKDLLELNNLEYNKLRQAKITKELSELIGGYQ